MGLVRNTHIVHIVDSEDVGVNIVDVQLARHAAHPPAALGLTSHHADSALPDNLPSHPFF